MNNNNNSCLTKLEFTNHDFILRLVKAKSILLETKELNSLRTGGNDYKSSLCLAFLTLDMGF